MQPGDEQDSMRRAVLLVAVLGLGVLVVWGLPAPAAAAGIAGYEPLHTLLETIAIVISGLVFAAGWNAPGRELPRNVVLLACGFIGVALLDFSHLLSFAGMPAYVTPSDPEKAINFWLAGRALAALVLLAAALVPWRPWQDRSTRWLVLGGVLAVTAAAHWVFLFHPQAMPRTFIAGSGLTALKVTAEYLLIAAYVVAAALFVFRTRRPDPVNAAALFAAVATMALSEVFFTLYASVTDLFNLMGHVYKVVAYLFLYRAVFVTTVERPYRQLHETRTRLQTTLQTIPDLLWLKDTDGVYLDCNPAFARLHGRTRDQIVGRRDDELMPAERAAQVRADDLGAMQQGRAVVTEEWLQSAADGHRGRFETLKTPLRDEEGRVIGVLGIARDITAARAGEEALRLSEERLRQATRVGHIGIFDHDHLADTVYWSREQRQHYGVGADEPVTLAGFLAQVHPADAARIAEAVQRAHDPSGDGLFDVEHRIVRRDGSIRTITTRSRTLFEGEGSQRHIVRTIGAVLDITDRKAADQALRVRDNALRTSLNAIAMSDLEGRLSYVNDAFVGLWHLDDAGQALGHPAEEFWRQPEEAREIVGALAAGARSWRGELQARRHDGTTFDVAVWASMAIGESGEPLGLMASFLDITERKRAEAELQQLNATLEARVQERTRELARRNEELIRAEKLAALGALVAGVAHELNTPVGNAVMVASTLSGRLREFEAGVADGVRRSVLDRYLASAREATEVLERNLERAAALIGSFKQLAVDQSSYQRRVFGLSEVVQEVLLALSPTLRRSGAEVRDETEPGLRLDSFPGPLGQVLINLINNAVVHAFEGRTGGVVRIVARPLGRDRLQLVISDDGRGIPPEHVKQLFDPFFTTRMGRGGSGLGLHIVFTLVTGLLGGRIEVRSEPGHGTAFHLELPCVAPAAREAAASPAAAVPH